IAKLLRDAAPSIRDVRASQLGSESSHVEVTLQMVVDKREERRVRSTLAKWSERSHIGNLTLVPHQSITLIPQEMPKEQSISLHPSGLVHAGENLVLSCRTSGGGVGSFGGGGSQPSFRWFKDGLFVNVTEPTSNKWIKEYENSETRDQYVSELGIKNASPIDQGSFTCQTVEDGMQKCLSKRVDVRAAPRVWIEPMSLTVRKGENFTIKCFSMSSGRRHKKSKYTYSWTKNKELLPIKTDTEHYEVLFPMGSILQVSSINKSTQFSCLVQDSAVWAEQSILVNVIDSHLIKTCPGERKLKLLWPETAPGTESLQECPAGYSGVARRACNLRDAGQPTWYLPDFAGCTPTKLIQLDYDFQKIRLGYGSGNALTILKGYKKYLVDGKSALLPGEGSRILGLVHEVISYINNSIATDVRNTVLEIVDQILQRKQAVINQTIFCRSLRIVFSRSTNNAGVVLIFETFLYLLYSFSDPLQLLPMTSPLEEYHPEELVEEGPCRVDAYHERHAEIWYIADLMGDFDTKARKESAPTSKLPPNQPSRQHKQNMRTNDNNILINEQHGFRSSDSSVHQVASLANDISI
ncbi:PREDICTED: uncharacterized protein LOC108557575, partial [Nicrophorus vespilloides]|uniref:Uncharacterized protein LOC108557575 n=1 Tax=Nicrophorus vespilloides TaxID=110193 RepID=A0ABM1M4Z6_NICVS